MKCWYRPSSRTAAPPGPTRRCLRDLAAPRRLRPRASSASRPRWRRDSSRASRATCFEVDARGPRAGLAASPTRAARASSASASLDVDGTVVSQAFRRGGSRRDLFARLRVYRDAVGSERVSREHARQREAALARARTVVHVIAPLCAQAVVLQGLLFCCLCNNPRWRTRVAASAQVRTRRQRFAGCVFQDVQKWSQTLSAGDESWQPKASARGRCDSGRGATCPRGDGWEFLRGLGVGRLNAPRRVASAVADLTQT